MQMFGGVSLKNITRADAERDAKYIAGSRSQKIWAGSRDSTSSASQSSGFLSLNSANVR